MEIIPDPTESAFSNANKDHSATTSLKNSLEIKVLISLNAFVFLVLVVSALYACFYLRGSFRSVVHHSQKSCEELQKEIIVSYLDENQNAQEFLNQKVNFQVEKLIDHAPMKSANNKLPRIEFTYPEDQTHSFSLESVTVYSVLNIDGRCATVTENSFHRKWSEFARQYAKHSKSAVRRTSSQSRSKPRS